MSSNPIFAGMNEQNLAKFVDLTLDRPIQLRYNRTVSMFGIEQVHEYVLKLVDADQCPEMDENCPEADKLDITKCFSGRLKNLFPTII